MTNQELTSLYETSCKKIMPHLILEGVPVKDQAKNPNSDSLKEGISGLEKVLQYQPENWAALWMLGKAQQAIGDNENSYQSFLKSHKIVNSIGEVGIDILRELTLQCLLTDRFEESIYYNNMAIKFEPNDYTLWANLAVCELLSGRLEESMNWVKKTLEKLPNDEPATNIKNILEEIRLGKRKIPKKFVEL